jgi:hypothetical protein
MAKAKTGQRYIYRNFAVEGLGKSQPDTKEANIKGQIRGKHVGEDVMHKSELL